MKRDAARLRTDQLRSGDQTSRGASADGRGGHWLFKDGVDHDSAKLIAAVKGRVGID